MEVIELYLFHGFLGIPDDWKEFEGHISAELRGRGLYCRMHRHNLWIDYERIINDGPHGGRDYFSVWAERKRQEFAHLSQKKVFVGYSMGGRLLMHLPLLPEDNVLAVCYVSAHPGLPGDKERQERRMMDFLWSESFAEAPWDDLMDLWNKQDVFANDRVRPQREEFHFKRELLSRYFKDWSLANQAPRDNQFKVSYLPQYWFYGAKDEKFKGLLPRVQQSLGAKRCIEVPKAGHGIIFDNPRFLAEQVVSIIAAKLKSEAAKSDV